MASQQCSDGHHAEIQQDLRSRGFVARMVGKSSAIGGALRTRIGDLANGLPRTVQAAQIAQVAQVAQVQDTKPGSGKQH